MSLLLDLTHARKPPLRYAPLSRFHFPVNIVWGDDDVVCPSLFAGTVFDAITQDGESNACGADRIVHFEWMEGGHSFAVVRGADVADRLQIFWDQIPESAT